MTKITVRGYREDVAAQEVPRPGDFGDLVGCEATADGTVRLAASRDDRAPEVEIAISEEDDVVELELDGGLRLWTTLGQLRQDYPESVKQEARGRGWRFDPQGIHLGMARGEGLRVLGFRRLKVWLKEKLVGEAAKVTGRLIACRIEEQLVGKPGLYRCGDAQRLELEPVSDDLPREDEPLLILIHGTGSTTAGSFGDLWEEGQIEQWRACLQRYPGGVYAYEHRTLSESPIENARDLARGLPGDARVHLVSHSRGGLVGELLCRGQVSNRREPFSAEEIALFEREGHGESLEALLELNELLARKRIRVERFVRVACPARGTTLASGRLDRYLSVFFNLVEQVPVFKASPAYGALSAFLLAVVKLRTDPREIPGLEAQMPESPLVAVLNGSPVELDADLSVIAGDFEGSGFFGRLKEFATNLYYWSRHDLVVNTEAMYGGGRRTEDRSRYFFDDGRVDGSVVNHFRYFVNPRTLRRLIAGLTRDDRDPAGFRPFTTVKDIPKTARIGVRGGPRPVVFVLPGILGSHLEVDGDRIWLDPGSLLLGGFGRLGIDARGVQAEALIGSVYHDLVAFLGQTHEVVPFPFDWRRSVREEGGRLAQALEARLKATEKPVRIVAHSMGGLVARVMVADHPDVWERLTRRGGGRLLMLGTPNAGSFAIPGILTGQEDLLRLLSVADLKNSEETLLALIARFPGILEMLPEWELDRETGDYFETDYFETAVWEKILPAQEDWPRPVSADLTRAREVRALIRGDAALDTEHMFYVAGKAEATPVGIERDSGGEPVRPVRFLATRRGDGRVPWDHGIPEGLPVWYADVVHGDLPKRTRGPFEDFDVFETEDNRFEAILEILERGNTDRLPRVPAVARGAEGAPLEVRPQAVQMYPDEAALVAAALGSGREGAPPPAARQLKVSVAHGNLGFAASPVLVGHYEGDTLISAESHLDRTLNGRLLERYRLGIYPGPVGTCEVLLNPGGKPGGAIVVGLGRVGDLTPGGLTRSVERAVLEFAVTYAETVPGGEAPVLTPLLVGTSAGGLGIRDSMHALLRGVLNANDAIARMELPPECRHRPRPVRTVEFLELFEDRAVQAASELRWIADEPRLRNTIVAEPLLRRRDGGLRRLAYEEPGGWWRRMEIVVQDDGSLKFTTLTDRARAEVRLQSTQRGLVDRFLEQAVRNTTDDEALSATLFELLIPNGLKEYAPDRTDLLLVVDEQAAAYPWELLRYRADGRAEPLALQAGVLRQLSLENFRERVITPVEHSVLVVGDPPTHLPPLPGAREEATQVADLLDGQEHVDVVRRCIGASEEEIVRALYERPYQILHLAGHGVYEYELSREDAQVTGLVEGGDYRVQLTGRIRQAGEAYGSRVTRITGMVIGDQVFLTPIEVEQMQRVPELVFINCCHLGFIEGKPVERETDRHRLAANLATQFIRMGVRAVVAAGWAVDDKAAATFATELYRQMLKGERYGDAVLQARRCVRQKHPGVNTWGAYQCYGDPDYTLVKSRSGSRQDDGCSVTPRQLVLELENMVEQARTASSGDRKQMLRRLEAVVSSLREDWKRDGALLAALGAAHGELGRFEEAIDYYRSALGAEDARPDLKMVEQLANLEVRRAARLHEDGRDKAANEAIKDAIGRLETLLDLGETVERLSLLGAAYKRRALVNRRARIRSLREMGRYYRNAHELHLKHSQGIDPYPLLNWLGSAVVLERITSQKDKDQEAGLAQFDELLARAEQTAREAGDTSFRISVVPPDCRLLRCVREDSLDDPAKNGDSPSPEKNFEVIVREYRAAYQKGSPREICSTRDNLKYLEEMLSTGKKTTATVEVLKRILESLANDFREC